jgi:hypothetical protein
MKLTNSEIYSYANKLMEVFQDSNQKLPIKINFYLQKNKNTLITFAQEIEKTRFEIIQSYGELNQETQQFVVPQDKIAEASKELNDLFNLEQDVNIYMINIDSLSDDYAMTTAQMEAIMFMIE